ncbi:hypothetical protein MMC25_004144 [Agyrium rufum]|nr:hypothetical protein [Agyrium rufum]
MLELTLFRLVRQLLSYFAVKGGLIDPPAIEFTDAAEGHEVAGIERPWKKYWPPTKEDDLQRWRKTDTPEFLQWRFDPTNPFDRPWRSYVRTKAAKKEPVYTTLPKDSQSKASEDQGMDLQSNQQHAADIPPVLCHKLQAEICDRRLPLVKVESFNYLAPLKLYQTQKPYLSRLPYAEDLKRSNIVAKSYPVNIYNIRGNEDLFSLDDSGFEFRSIPFQLNHWSDAGLQKEYIPFLTQWLKKHFQTERVLIYAYNFRGNDPNPTDKPWKNPFHRAHCDATEASCRQRMKQHFPGEVEEVLEQRYRFIKYVLMLNSNFIHHFFCQRLTVMLLFSIWRSITPPDQDCPLALCDYRTVTKEDYLRTDVVFPHCCDEGYDVLYSPAHRWFYQKGMSTDEVIMFKLDDSADGVARCTAHGAFNDPTANPACASRASVELRAIIVGGT